MNRTLKAALGTTMLSLAALAAPTPLAAHCDSMDGPVVRAAREALAAGDLTPVLKWVRAQDEPEIRRAFERTLKVRAEGGEARDLADLWFFENVVRVHRAGEGEPYTGLKPAGYETPAGIAAADRALEAGNVEHLIDRVSENTADALRERYDRVIALRNFDPDDVESGRRYIRAYVEYIHFVESLHGLLHSEAGSHAASAGLDAH